MRRDIPFRQVLASIGQSQLMQAYDNPFGEQGTLTVQAPLTRRDLAAWAAAIVGARACC